MSGPRSYSRSTIKQLFALSRNLCYFPGCEEKLADSRWPRVNAEIAHICAAVQGGPRFDATMTDRERADFPNLMLLCPNHSHRVDYLEPDSYPVEHLREIKENHERHEAARDWASSEVLDRYVTMALEQSTVSTGPKKTPSGDDVYARWPGSSPTEEMIERIDTLGDLGHAHFAELAEKSVLAVRRDETPAFGPEELGEMLEQSRDAGLAQLEHGLWSLSDDGWIAARLYTAVGPPPRNVDITDLIFASDRMSVQSRLGNVDTLYDDIRKKHYT